MRQLNHEHVVSIYDFYKDDPKYFYMVLELMKGGELLHCIQRKVFAQGCLFRGLGWRSGLWLIFKGGGRFRRWRCS